MAEFNDAQNIKHMTIHNIPIFIFILIFILKTE